jgi:hypothetical protein
MVAAVWFTPPVLAPSGGLVAGTSARQANQHMGRTKRRCSTARSTPVAPGGTFPSTCTSCKCGMPPRSSARCADQPSRSNQFQPGWQQTRTQACWIGSSATQSCYQLQLQPPTLPTTAILPYCESAPSPQSMLVHRNKPAVHRIRQNEGDALTAIYPAWPRSILHGGRNLDVGQ